eukprot:gene13642-19522_t
MQGLSWTKYESLSPHISSYSYTGASCRAYLGPSPILDQVRVPVAPDIKAPDLTVQLFRLGSSLLLTSMVRVLSGEGMRQARPQQASEVTHAKKLDRQEGYLDFRLESAQALHNKIRAFARWPGTRVKLTLEDGCEFF